MFTPPSVLARGSLAVLLVHTRILNVKPVWTVSRAAIRGPRSVISFRTYVALFVEPRNC